MRARIHHLQVAAPPGCEPAARHFFRDTLGWEEVPKPAHLARRGGAWFRLPAGGGEVHVGVEDPFTPALKAHPAFLVDDLAAVRARLDAAGARTWEDEALPGFKRFYAADPWGNRLEFLERATG